jgi:hypothetical protein
MQNGIVSGESGSVIVATPSQAWNEDLWLSVPDSPTQSWTPIVKSSDTPVEVKPTNVEPLIKLLHRRIMINLDPHSFSPHCQAVMTTILESSTALHQWLKTKILQILFDPAMMFPHLHTDVFPAPLPSRSWDKPETVVEKRKYQENICNRQEEVKLVQLILSEMECISKRWFTPEAYTIFKRALLTGKGAVMSGIGRLNLLEEEGRRVKDGCLLVTTQPKPTRRPCKKATTSTLSGRQSVETVGLPIFRDSSVLSQESDSLASDDDSVHGISSSCEELCSKRKRTAPKTILESETPAQSDEKVLNLLSKAVEQISTHLPSLSEKLSLRETSLKRSLEHILSGPPELRELGPCSRGSASGKPRSFGALVQLDLEKAAGANQRLQMLIGRLQVIIGGMATKEAMMSLSMITEETSASSQSSCAF